MDKEKMIKDLIKRTEKDKRMIESLPREERDAINSACAEYLYSLFAEFFSLN